MTLRMPSPQPLRRIHGSLEMPCLESVPPTTCLRCCFEGECAARRRDDCGGGRSAILSWRPCPASAPRPPCACRRPCVARGDLVGGPSFRFHPDVGVTREHGAPDVPVDVHDHLVAGARSRVPPPSGLDTTCQTDGHDARRAPSDNLPSCHLAAPMCANAPGPILAANGPTRHGFVKPQRVPGRAAVL